jgi:hypothetical protein
MKFSGFGGIATAAGILLCLCTGCTQKTETAALNIPVSESPAQEIPPVETPAWEQILDEVPWENRLAGNVEEDVNTIPDDLFSVMYGYGYQYVNSAYTARQKNESGIADTIYELTRENTSYDPDDDTFMFVGEFYPDETNIWLLFSKENNDVFVGPDDPDTIFIKTKGRRD